VVAFIVSWIALGAGLAIVLWFMQRRPVGAPLTWGEAYVGATFVFFLMFLAYGIVPHQWLNWADNELKWRPDRLVEGPFHLVGKLPIEISYQTIRDLVATVIYVVMLGLQLVLWSVWQNRGRTRPAEIPTSRYGRPLVKRS
jgi:hypothetical protein